ncbi:hypothetical protein B484DRAFT_416676 [Ochromonadaceae sp. CCMP2298]|nr:hypothetical protein B484DRAFT_416676 [Ochromonadaceae sp. CCMP2298]
MVKVRGGKVKAKVFSDFSKTKSRVGRKVKRANVTEIKVKSKSINVPLQNIISPETRESHKEQVVQIVRQLHHYSENIRLAALARAKDLLHAGISAELFVSQVMPEVVELLFNAEKETRTAVLQALELMFSTFKASDFQSVTSVIVTYICSGLTNLHKGIRKDSLMLLKTISARCPELLRPYLGKIVTHILSLLTEAFQAASVPLLTQGVVATAKKERPSPTTFILILQVLEALLQVQGQGGGGTGGVGRGLRFSFDPLCNSNAALLLCGIDRAAYATSTPSSTTTSVGIEGGLNSALLEAVMQHMRTVWHNLAADQASLSEEVIGCLQAAVRTMQSAYRLSTGTLGTLSSLDLGSTASLGAVVGELFTNFPHSCAEVEVAAPGSEQERRGLRVTEALDVTLCELAFTFFSSSASASASAGTDMSDAETYKETYTDSMGEDADVDAGVGSEAQLRSTAGAYLLQRLASYVQRVTNKGNKGQGNKGNKGQQEQGQGARKDEEGPSETEKASVLKIFQSFQMMVSPQTLSALLQLLRLLQQLLSALAGEGARRPLRYLANPAAYCLCRIVAKVHPELGDQYPEEVYALLVGGVADALLLAVTANWEQTALVGELAGAALLLLQGRAFAQGGGAGSQQMLSARTRLCAAFDALWEVTDGRNGFLSCPAQVRYRILDMFAYLPFEDTYAAADAVMACMTGDAQAETDQIAYFIRIAFNRREEVAVGDFVQLLFGATEAYIEARCAVDMEGEDGKEEGEEVEEMEMEGVEESKEEKGGKGEKERKEWARMQGEAAVLLGSRWIAHEVGAALVWMSSPDTPEKIVSFVGGLLQGWLDAADAENEEAEGALRAVYLRSAVLVIASQLLQPWVAAPLGLRQGQEAGGRGWVARDMLLGWIVSTCAKLLDAETAQGGYGFGEELGGVGMGGVGGGGEELGRFKLNTVAALASLRVLGPQSPTASPAAPAYLLFTGLLEHLVRAQAEGGSGGRGSGGGRVQALRNLHAVMQSECFDEAVFLACRPALALHLDSICHSQTQTKTKNKALGQTVKVAGAGGVVEEEVEAELAQNLAKDILLLF